MAHEDLGDGDVAHGGETRLGNVLGRIGDDAIGEKSEDFARRGLSWVFRVGGRAKDSAGNGVAKGVGAVTLRDYRETVEGAMAQVVDVLAAHEAEIEALRKRVAELEEDLQR